MPLLPTSGIPQAVHLRMAACASRESLLALEKGTGLRAMVGEWSLALTDCATWIDGVGPWHRIAHAQLARELRVRALPHDVQRPRARHLVGRWADARRIV